MKTPRASARGVGTSSARVNSAKAHGHTPMAQHGCQCPPAVVCARQVPAASGGLAAGLLAAAPAVGRASAIATQIPPCLQRDGRPARLAAPRQTTDPAAAGHVASRQRAPTGAGTRLLRRQQRPNRASFHQASRARGCNQAQRVSPAAKRLKVPRRAFCPGGNGPPRSRIPSSHSGDVAATAPPPDQGTLRVAAGCSKQQDSFEPLSAAVIGQLL